MLGHFLTPRFPARRPLGPARLILRSQWIQVFDRKLAAEKPWTEKLWIYDLRTNKHFTL
jgi:hypothetical protein